jgi:S-adenosylmethionine:tRNA ribosyltransferase-isomerase
MTIKQSLPRALKSYGYELPSSAIAQTPVSPRDAAKLLVYDRSKKTQMHTTFRSIAKILPPRSVIVLNDTKVIPSRLRALRSTGGAVEVFVLRQQGKRVTALMNKVCVEGDVLRVGKHRLIVGTRNDREVELQVDWSERSLSSILQTYGQTPLPPYLKKSPLTEARRRSEYQSVVAKYEGSVAAPTASLHFTPRLLRELKQAGHTIVHVTLHVGLGTFAPVTEAHITSQTLHTEEYSITATAARQLNLAKKEGRAIIAVGTTVARALESATKNGAIKAGKSSTKIFIRPGYRWQMVDGLITNFHVPYSSLLMLVASLIGERKWKRLYRLALRSGYRFLSFGDGMFIQPVI